MNKHKLKEALASPETIEPIIVRRVITTMKYWEIMSSFNKSWLVNQDLAHILMCWKKFVEKRSTLPSPKMLALVLEKLTSTDLEKLSSCKRQLLSLSQINLEDYDEEYLDTEILLYLKNNAYCSSILDGVDVIKNTQDAGFLAEQLSFINQLSFDSDLGLDLFDDIDKSLDKLCEEESKFSTGWASFDALFSGGLPVNGKILGVFLGETHIGKSLILSNLACNLTKQGKFVVLITLEMSELSYLARICAHYTGVNVNLIQELKEDSIKKFVRATLEDIKEKSPTALLRIKEFPPDTISPNTIKHYCDKVQSFYKRKIDCVIVDYIGLMISNNSTSNNSGSFEKFDDVSKQLRALSYIFKCSVISAQQFNREGFSAEPQTNKVQGSIGISQNADFIVALYQRGENNEDKKTNTLRTKCLKNRLGGQVGHKNIMHCDYSGASLKISDIALSTNNDIESDILASIPADF